MKNLNRREFLIASSQVAAVAMAGTAPAKTGVGLVRSDHKALPRPASPEDPLDYTQVRDMVWKAIEYGRPGAGSLEAKVKPGSWVVVKPNIVSLRPRRGYRTGDITDMRVTKAVVEYLARKSRAARITVAEGGSYRNLHDPAKDNVTFQNDVRVNAATFDWGTDEFPGFAGSLGGMLKEFSAQFPGRKFDYVDLSYDTVRDASGQFRRIEVPRSPNGVGAFGERPDYYVTNTILNCDFLVSVPVMKVHDLCGITACLKNYVGTAPREAYARPGIFSNSGLHAQHSLEGRIDSFITDLAAFHPPDFCVVDGLRGLQYAEHNNGRPDQMIRSNLIMAGECAVATDAVLSQLIGFNSWDIEFLHMASQRQMGTMDFGKIDVVGDEADRLERYWAKPRHWFGRANREWRISTDPAVDLAAWKRVTIPTDTLRLPGPGGAAAVRVHADGHSKAFLWVGLHGRVTATLNGETVMQEENRTRYRIGQFRQPVELRSGENLLVFRVEALEDEARLSAHIIGPRNDGDSLKGIRWTA
jgi:uncharacterized protein (DUF362 family)